MEIGLYLGGRTKLGCAHRGCAHHGFAAMGLGFAHSGFEFAHSGSFVCVCGRFCSQSCSSVVVVVAMG